MARLTVFAEDARLLSETADAAEIGSALAPAGATLRSWDVIDVTGLAPDQVLAAYRAQVGRLSDDEVRYFAAGSGVFYLHAGAAVYAVLCQPGDLLSVPKGIAHWFDMGAHPDFTVIRFFREPQGWVGDFTGNPIAERIPGYDAITCVTRT
jgi:1,2-dihydroxy-3-keto-5-methylthiopentene dioxygenase